MQFLFLQKIFLKDEKKKINQEISKAIKSNIDFTYKTDKRSDKWCENSSGKFIDRYICSVINLKELNNQ